MTAPLLGPTDRPGSAPPPAVRIRAHPGLCLGYGNCHRFAPKVYPLDEDGQIAVHLMEVPEELAIDAWRGASVCPERAITVIGEPEEYWIERRRQLDEPGEEAERSRSQP